MGRTAVDEIVNKLILTKESFSSRDVSSAAGVTRQAVHRHLRQLVASGQLVQRGKGRAVRYHRARPAFSAHLTRADGLAEDRVWEQARAALPGLEAYPDAAAVLATAFTEMLNNAIDHSGSPTIDVEVRLDAEADLARFEVVDGGIGAFENVRVKSGLGSGLEALQLISKGKTSTQPDRHSGEGLFFTSKMARTFELEANGLAWLVDNVRQDQAIAERPVRPGTTVRFETSLGTATKLEELYARYTHDFEFDTSRVVIKLFEHGVRFVSRSEAKRLLVGLERFRHVILDFAGVEGVGQGFADEIFRVWARSHPEARLRAENMASPVAFMIELARRAATARA